MDSFVVTIFRNVFANHYASDAASHPRRLRQPE